ncbi:hypothetical protein [Kitasatospora cineracea]|uniref:Uncharacterized protein n=1 Tax=Kitasatospora cineracea TaxID=88074 RepID=A0A3N4R9E5_9ACTN|nr:hypothetical protein [Kitasatospora cineracea]RPE27231.1 hypothetical protein EDD38_7375 [Kitasatospora cineracea]RPE27363.1 hypothetical protein EDD38_7508 [Kitasatospora cineracea]
MSDHPPARRGRGRPPTLTGPRLQELLDHLADGLTIQQAATATGIARATVYNTRAHDPAAADAITTALAAGKAKRTAARHGTEGCYTRHGCRRPECTAAATAARTTRRTAGTDTVLPTPVTAAALPAPTGRTTLVLLDLHTTAPLAQAG